MTSVRTKVSHGGRVVIPAEFRRALGLNEGDEVILFLQDGEVRMVTPERAIDLAQELVRQYVPTGVSLVDELIAERRREAERE
jgi:AbrB family looped-hinge helix DNA binding protein